jgi:repressor LexA
MSTRPTKKQYGLMQFIAAFIAENGYGPSYREIMNGLGYTSVATVAEHINNLIARGHLRKRDRSARSLEVISMPEPELEMDKSVSEAEEK